MNDLRQSKNAYLILDTTVFIRLDFPQLIETTEFSNVRFKTVPSILPELKDFRSKTNFNLMKDSGLLEIHEPEFKILQKITQAIKSIEPLTSLSPVDIDILALATELDGTLMSFHVEVSKSSL